MTEVSNETADSVTNATFFRHASVTQPQKVENSILRYFDTTGTILATLK